MIQIDKFAKVKNKVLENRFSISRLHIIMLLAILFITFAVLCNSFLPKISWYYYLDLMNLLPNLISDSNLKNIERIQITQTLILVVGALSTIFAIVFTLMINSIERIADKYTPYIIDDYRRRVQNKTLPVFAGVIIFSFLLIAIIPFIHHFSALICFIVVIIGFILCITRLILYFSDVIDIIDPIKFASILEKRTIKLIKNDKIEINKFKDEDKDAKKLLTTFGDITVKSLERNDKTVSSEYARKLYSIYIESIVEYGKSSYIEQLVNSYSRILNYCITTKNDLRFEIMDKFAEIPWILYITKKSNWFEKKFFDEYEYYLNSLFSATKKTIDEDDLKLFESEIDSISLRFISDPKELINKLNYEVTLIDLYTYPRPLSIRDILKPKVDKLQFSINRLKRNFGTFSEYETILSETRDLLPSISDSDVDKDKVEEKNETLKQLYLKVFLDFNFHKIFLLIGTYCLFGDKQQSIDSEKYIRELWLHTNPEDSCVITCNEVPVTSDPEILLYMFFWGGVSDSVWYDRYRFDSFHGIKPYLSKYVLLRLTDLRINHNKKLEISNLESMEKEELEFTIKFLNQFLNEVDDLIKHCEELIEEHTKWEYLFPNKVQTKGELDSSTTPEIEKVTTKMQFEKTKEWLLANKIEFKKKLGIIEEKLPIDCDKMLQCKMEICRSFTEDELISKAVTFYEFGKDEIKDAELIKIGYNNNLPKNCFTKVSDVDCFAIWNQYGTGLANGEVNYFVNTINSMMDIKRMKITKTISIIELFKLVSSSVSSLKDNGFSPSVILLPHKYYRQFIEESWKKDTKLCGVLSQNGNILKIDDHNQLDIIIPHGKEMFEEVIIGDKNVCIWNFKPSLEENNRVHIDVIENELDASKVNLKIQIMVLLKVENVDGLMILSPESDSN